MKEFIELKGVKTHNLKGVDCSIPIGELTVVSGVSGSGKSSLAFDTLYAEGQRRYTESLSTYARQFLQRMERPPVDAIIGVQPAVALRQTVEVTNSRSTVGTVSEIDDHLHLLFTHAGETICPICDLPVERDTASASSNHLLNNELGSKFVCVAEVRAPEPEQRHALLRQLIQEGFRRYFLDGEIVDVEDANTELFLDQEIYAVVIDRLVIKKSERQRIGEAIETGLQVGGGRIVLYRHDDLEADPLVFDRAFRCNTCGTEYVEPQPALFSFNSSLGACEVCAGFGKMIGLDFSRVIPHPSRSIRDGAVEPFRGTAGRKHQKELVAASKDAGVSVDTPWRNLSTEHQRFVKYGGDSYYGVRGYFDELKRDKKAGSRIAVAKYRGYSDCETCLGSRASSEALNVRFAGRTVGDLWRMRIEEARLFFDELDIPNDVEAAVEIVLEEIRTRLYYLDDIGLGYLTLDRSSRSLSGGEMQRIQLTTSIGRALTDTLYVLDEPTAGLHATDSERLLGILKRLRDAGNTVVVVEHDPEIIRGADYVVEMGPYGGERGGEVVFQGTFAKFQKSDTLTKNAMQASPVISSANLGAPENFIEIRGASEHNLNEVSVSIPIERMIAISGVSGSGKSTLMHDVLFNHWRFNNGYSGVRPGAVESIAGLDEFDEVVMMDQSALGRSSRSNPMSYSKVYDDIRKLFSATNAAKIAGLTPGSFSFNSPGGRCETCAGLGVVTLEMHFLADVDVMCEVCHGKRFTPKVLDVKFREKSILDVFGMTVDDALGFFEGHRSVVRKLRTLQDVGLGYIRMGQSTSTLSGGEAQRLKLSTFLLEGRKSNALLRALFIFDEPTVGLHLEDIDTLYDALRQLVDFGHTVIIIEHNIELIARCDHVIDIGPGGGPAGGQIVSEGTPIEAAEVDSPTGRALSGYFGR